MAGILIYRLTPSTLGRMLEFKIVPKSDFTGLSPITQASGVCFDEHGKILLLKQEGKKWNIPGGTLEENETPEETLRREVYEETTVRLGQCVPIAYQEVYEDGRLMKYQVRFACLVDSIEPQQPDPDKGKIHQRIFVEPERVMEYVEYPQFKELFDLAVQWYKRRI
jgi:ADP-ribose pyrophosphatase YjhB (NUDIX family)